MKRRILFALVGMAVVVAILGGVKALQIRAMIAKNKNFVPPPETVTSAVVKAESWGTALTSVGTVNAVQGVTIAAELAGKVVGIDFDSGAMAAKGDILLRQDTSSEEAQLPGAVAQAELARTNLARSEQLFNRGIISAADRDNAVAAAKQALALADNIRATIGKKTIRAPFSGRIGIRQVNLGQMLREGDPVVTLQSFDPIYVDFTLPQQDLAQVGVGLPVSVSTDALPGVTVKGRITAISPQVDAETRSVKIEATVANPDGRLRAGMFVNAAVGMPTSMNVLAIPATAVLYAPYGDSVFIIEKQEPSKGRGMVIRQQFVRLGEKRGDFIAVTSGLKEGDVIVSTGVFKLRNGQSVVVDNKLAPTFNLAPAPENS